MRRGILDMVYPKRCPVCDDILYQKNRVGRPVICRECENVIKYIHSPACLRCGKQLEDEGQEFCHDCNQKKFDYNRGVAAFSYSESIKKSMYAFKYNNRQEYAGFYADVIYENLGNVIKGFKAQVIVPVPLHRKKLMKRGYNQAQILAEQISKRCGIPMDETLLFRTKNTRPQKELDDKGRAVNIENAFQTGSNSIKYNRILLVDDIYTTGTTINECARALKLAGALEVYFVTACVGRGF